MIKSLGDSAIVRGIMLILLIFCLIALFGLITNVVCNFVIEGISQVDKHHAGAYPEKCMYCGETATARICAGKDGLLLIDSDKFPTSEYYSVNGLYYERTSTGYVPRKDTYLVPDEKGWRVETERSWKKKTYSEGTGSNTIVEGYYCDSHKSSGESLIRRQTIFAYTLKNFY